jgi:hypothetical protein
MATHVASGDLHFHFDPKFREYGITYSDDGKSVQLINFCPWCGSKLGASLRSAWFDKLDALGIDPDGDIPANFTTDEWWNASSQ